MLLVEQIQSLDEFIHIIASLFVCEAITLPDQASQFIAVLADAVQLIVGKPSPALFDPALHLFPFAYHDVFIKEGVHAVIPLDQVRLRIVMGSTRDHSLQTKNTAFNLIKLKLIVNTIRINECYATSKPPTAPTL